MVRPTAHICRGEVFPGHCHRRMAGSLVISIKGLSADFELPSI